MAEVIEMIQLSPTMEEGVLVMWLKQKGDSIAAGDLIAEVETDKATMEMESFFDGVILEVFAEAGDAVPVGGPLAIVGEAGEDVADLVAELRSAPPKGLSAPAGLSSASSPPGPPSAGAPAPPLSGSPQLPEAEAPVASPTAGAASSPGTEPPPSRARRSDGRVLSSPLARKIAAERGVDIGDVVGTGPAGRVVRRDVEAWEPAAASVRPSGAAAARPARLEAQTVRLSQMRKAIARNLTEAWKAPAFSLTREVDMARSLAFRAEVNSAFERDGTGRKLSVNDLIVKACGMALAAVPDMNVAYAGDALVMYPHADIGVAVAIDGGLITPVIRSVEQKTLTAISAESRSLAERARAKKLQPDEFTGATFSISNLGMYGVDHFGAVLNPPAAGILAVGQTRRVPIVSEDLSFAVGQRMSITLTCDHRAVDGATGATFLQYVARYLESPPLMLV